MKDHHLTLKKINTFTPSGDACKRIKKAIEKSKDSLGNRYLLHPDNFVQKRPTEHSLLTIWLAGRVNV